MGTPIKLANAAKYYKGEPHQEAAWDWLEAQLEPDQLARFQVRYRNAPGEPALGGHDKPASGAEWPLTKEQLDLMRSCSAQQAACRTP